MSLKNYNYLAFDFDFSPLLSSLAPSVCSACSAAAAGEGAAAEPVDVLASSVCSACSAAAARGGAAAEPFIGLPFASNPTGVHAPKLAAEKYC